MSMDGVLTLDRLKAMAASIPRAPPPVRLVIVPSWLSGYKWIDGGPPRQPPPRAQRKGTRRQWKRAANRNSGWRRRWVHIEPDHMFKTPDGATYCTEAQYRAVKHRLADTSER